MFTCLLYDKRNLNLSVIISRRVGLHWLFSSFSPSSSPVGVKYRLSKYFTEIRSYVGTIRVTQRPMCCTVFVRPFFVLVILFLSFLEFFFFSRERERGERRCDTIIFLVLSYTVIRLIHKVPRVHGVHAHRRTMKYDEIDNNLEIAVWIVLANII